MKTLVILSTFIAMSSAITIHCNFTMIVEDRYDCWATILSYEEVTLTSVSGTHMDGKSDADVDYIGFNGHPDLTFIPQGIHDFFPAFTVLNLYGCGIRSLSGAELDEYVKLRVFIMHENKLERVPGGLFKNNGDLAVISFGFNQIRHVGDGLLDGLSILRDAYFEENVCVNKTAESREEIALLIEHFRTYCSDPIATTSDPTCPAGDETERICVLEETALEQSEINGNVRDELDYLRERLEELALEVQELRLRHCNF